jgi:hypothetical protein
MIKVTLNNKVFSKLKVISEIEKREKGRIMWKCKCECGNQIVVDGGNLKSGKTKSCGCLRKKVTGDRKRKHGQTNTRFYKILEHIKSRCNNKKSHNYKYYGGRGIKVCNRWQKFENFSDDMLQSYIDHVEKYGEKNTTIDRIDNNGDYKKANCRWSTIQVQSKNRRQRTLI